MHDPTETVVRLAALHLFAAEELRKAHTAENPDEHITDAKAALQRALELEREAA